MIRVYFKKLENGNLEINEKMLNHILFHMKSQDEEIERLSNIIEDKKIKRIQSCGDNLYSEYIGQWLVNKDNYTEYDELLMNKINEIIDKINRE